MNENPTLKEMFACLATPFRPEDIEWRAGATNADKTKALALAYITSRAVMDRLDEIVGPENWRDEYQPGPDGGVICGLSLRIHGEWITKWDGAENTDFEAIKGGLSDAFKRAGYKWGIGRYLYRLESSWVACEAHGKNITLKVIPTLPAWALPPELKHRVKWPETDKPPELQAAEPPKPGRAEREKQILQELGYEPKPDKVTVPHPTSPNGGNGSSAKAVSPKPQPVLRRTSWGADVVMAVLNNQLAKTASDAVTLLNQSDLPTNATPEQAVAALRKGQN